MPALTEARTTILRAKITASDEPGTLSGQAVPYDVDIEAGGPRIVQVITRGAFSRQLADPSRVKVLWQHRHDAPIGRVTALRDTAAGLQFAAKVIDDQAVPHGAEAMALIRAGVLDEVSVGFEWDRFTEETDGDTFRVVHERARLLEVSVVTHGAAGRDATIRTAASATHAQVNAWRARFAAAMVRNS